ncbi:hypothetical protein SAMN02746041_01977 [Desulfacinum hydrothermale DSM 13146]|uniref:Uncharacterized protein n=2 Tax=Desulfacinum hydrothermale TaxID=109258 RepID=A0A1W1XK80_9BACT|nr:hypothetical protein SAMN02746041_01977 [Desulfacinum hydrothermale DSM 13146]
MGPQEVIKISWLPEARLVHAIGFVGDHSVPAESLFWQGNEGPVKVVKTYNDILAGFFDQEVRVRSAILVVIMKPPLQRHAGRQRSLTGKTWPSFQAEPVSGKENSLTPVAHGTSRTLPVGRDIQILHPKFGRLFGGCDHIFPLSLGEMKRQEKVKKNRRNSSSCWEEIVCSLLWHINGPVLLIG